MTHRLLVLGAGYAGLGAARRAARRLRRTDVEVTLINATDRFVERIRLHQRAAGQALRDRSLRTMLDGADVKLVVARVTAIDVDARIVRPDGQQGGGPDGLKWAGSAGCRYWTGTWRSRNGPILTLRASAVSGRAKRFQNSRVWPGGNFSVLMRTPEAAVHAQ